MPTIFEIVTELNENNGSNHKLAVLRKYKDNELLKRVLKMTYDKAAFTYGISMKNVSYNPSNISTITFAEALDILETLLATRKITGNAAISLLTETFEKLTFEDADVLRKIINRDLRINCGRSNINKVWPQLITKPAYMRCGIFTSKTAKDISFPAIIQLKADGTYREFVVLDGLVSSTSRSGEDYDYPNIFSALSSVPDGRYFGELVVYQDDKPLDRQTGNGLINSDTPPHDDIRFFVWDYVTHEEYSLAMFKGKPNTKYADRYKSVVDIIVPLNSKFIEIIETHEVENIKDALQLCNTWMTAGFEGAILKDKNGVFKDGTSKHQLKLKLEIDVDVRITGFKEGKVGTVREKTFGSVEYSTDDGLIKGYASGFTNEQLETFNQQRESMLGKIMTLCCNDITKARDNEYYALSHPRFVELRTDKTETDTFERALQAKESAMTLKGEK